MNKKRLVRLEDQMRSIAPIMTSEEADKILVKLMTQLCTQCEDGAATAIEILIQAGGLTHDQAEKLVAELIRNEKQRIGLT